LKQEDYLKLKIGLMLLVTVSLVLVSVALCSAADVVVYTSVDQVYSEPVLKAFEKKTGIKVKALYDVEAAKTVGLVNRLIAEKDRPQADVFWNSEVGRTIVLSQKGVLTPYKSKYWKTIPDTFKDKNYYWTGFGARARVLIYNTNMLKSRDLPKSIFELTEPKWKGKVTIAYPVFGTTSTQVAALYSLLGIEKTEKFLRGLVNNKAVVVDGNSVTRDVVVAGEVPIGFTDTDDAFVAITQGKPVKMLYPDKDGIGTLLIPNTVALIKNGPNAENGRKLIDYLLSEEVESSLAFSEFALMPLRKNVKRPAGMVGFNEIRAMKVDYYDIAAKMEGAAKFCQELFIK
jgi:iron(III) transport system substrate-binding protein